MKRYTRTDLTQRVSAVLRESYKNPVMITDRGADSHVLMTIEHYMELMRKLEAKEGKEERPNAPRDG